MTSDKKTLILSPNYSMYHNWCVDNDEKPNPTGSTKHPHQVCLRVDQIQGLSSDYFDRVIFLGYPEGFREGHLALMRARGFSL